jgi:predicted kinase
MEYKCWGNARAFASPNARFQYFAKEEEYPEFVPFDDFGSTVVLMSGLPGAGKDSYVWEYYHDWPVINLDDIRRAQKVLPTDKAGNGRVVQLAKEQARAYLRKKQNFVWNATNITRTMRGQLADLFLTYKAFVKIVYVEVPHKVLHRHNRDREDAVPVAVVNRLAAKLEVPVPWEAHGVEYYVK